MFENSPSLARFRPREARESLTLRARRKNWASLETQRSRPGADIWDTAFQQLVKHPDLSVTDYGRLPTLVEHGTTIRHPGRRSLSFFGKFHGRWYKAVVKRTEEDEIYLVTFHESHTRNLRSEQKRGVLVRDAR